MPKIYATVRVKSRILSRVIYSAAPVSGGGHVIEDEGTPLPQRDDLNFTGAGVTASDLGGKTVVDIPGGGGVALQDGSGTTFNTDKVDLGGVITEAITRLEKPDNSTFQIIPPAINDGELQRFSLSNQENLLAFISDASDLWTAIAQEKGSATTQNIGGTYILATQINNPRTSASVLGILENGSIAVGDVVGEDRFTKMYYTHDLHAKWAALSQALQDRIIPDIGWVNANTGGSQFLALGTFNPAMVFNTQGDYTNYTLVSDIVLTATAIVAGLYRAVYITQSAGETYSITIGAGISKISANVDVDGDNIYTLLPGSYMHHMAALRAGPTDPTPAIQINVPEGNVIIQSFPTILSLTISADNTYADLSMSEGVYGDIAATNPVLFAKLNIVFAANGGTSTDWTGSSVKQNDAITEGAASALVGGETTLRIFGSLTGIPDGQETLTIGPLDAVSMFSSIGNAMNAGETGVDNLQTSIILVHDPLDNGVIDTSIWDEITDPNGSTVETSVLTLAASGATSNAYGVATLNGYTSSNDLLIAQVSITHLNNAIVTPRFAMTATQGDDSTDRALVIKGLTVGEYDAIRLITQDGGVTELNETSAITYPQTVRIKYVPSTGALTFEYWNGSAWASLGSGGNVDLGTTIYANCLASANAAGGTDITFSDFYISRDNYSTLNPV